MNDRYKFRGISKESKEWEYGNLIIHVDILDSNRFYYYIEDITGEDRVEVIPETVGQATGLKDKNGKEIYEHDVLTVCGRKYIVEYLDGVFGTKCKNIDSFMCLNDWLKYNKEANNNFVVIGTIHDKELED